MTEYEQKVFDLIQKQKRISLIGICAQGHMSRITALNAVNALIKQGKIDTRRVKRQYLYITISSEDTNNQLTLWS